MCNTDNNGDPTEPGEGECTGCQLTRKGNPDTALPDGDLTIGHQFRDTDGSLICDLTFTFTGKSGVCKPEDCSPQDPCKFRNPTFSMQACSRTIALTVTNINGSVSPKPEKYETIATGPGQGAPPVSGPMSVVGGSGTPGVGEGYGVNMVCGATSQKFRFRIDYFDQGLASQNSQEFEVELACSSCVEAV